MDYLMITILIVVSIISSATPSTANSRVCNNICTREMKPVCGSNKNGERETFSNICLFQYRQCRQKEEQWTLQDENGGCDGFPTFTIKIDPKCAKPCTFIYKPVCYKEIATGELKEFANQCAYDNEVCDNNNENKYEFVKAGKC